MVPAMLHACIPNRGRKEQIRMPCLFGRLVLVPKISSVQCFIAVIFFNMTSRSLSLILSMLKTFIFLLCHQYVKTWFQCFYNRISVREVTQYSVVYLMVMVLMVIWFPIKSEILFLLYCVPNGMEVLLVIRAVSIRAKMLLKVLSLRILCL